MPTTIGSLPNEVLGNIFTFCATYCADAPLILPAVSRSFYLVAHGTPRAWSKLRLGPRKGDKTSEQYLVRKAELWFARAGHCSLDLFVDLTMVDAEENTRFLTLTGLLSSHRPRIQTLNVQSNTELKGYEFLDAVYHNHSSTSSSLQSLRIRITSDIPDTVPATWSPVFNSFDMFPALQSLKLTNHILPASPISNLSHLRTLTIFRPLRAHPLPAVKITTLLESAPMVERLEIDSRVGVDRARHPIELNSLRELVLRTNNLPFVLSLINPGAELDELRLTDLDGRRRDAAVELGIALEAKDSGVFTNLGLVEVSAVSFPSNDATEAVWSEIVGRMSDPRGFRITNSFGGDVETLALRLMEEAEDLAIRRPDTRRKRHSPDRSKEVERSFISGRDDREAQASTMSMSTQRPGGFGFGSSFHLAVQDFTAPKVEWTPALNDVDSAW
ncbi:hypothetical protein PM082_003371 [Marasmius tenuissimus]|nr:hypothetical protein PM082_003371 [Marasmius tenuissimus]